MTRICVVPGAFPLVSRRLAAGAQAVAFAYVCPNLMPPFPDWEWFVRAGKAALRRGLELLRLRRKR